MFRKTSADSQEAASLEDMRQETAELNKRLWAHTKELEAIGQLLQQEQEKTRDMEEELFLQRKRADEAESKSTISPGTDLNLSADDMLLYRCIDSTEHVEYLQHDNDLLSHWVKTNYLSLNPTKCRHMVVSRKSSE